MDTTINKGVNIFEEIRNIFGPLLRIPVSEQRNIMNKITQKEILHVHR